VKSTQSSFQRQVESLIAVFENMGNPLKETSNDLLVLDIRDIADIKVSTTVREVDLVWNRYVSDRLKSTTRINIGQGVRRRVEPGVKLPGD